MMACAGATLTVGVVLLERSETWGFLFEEERAAFARALLGDEA